MRIPDEITRKSRPGFTLVELLTVVAIIAVLASLFLTGLASAKKKSRTMICTNNLHQFALAVGLYMEDSGGKRPTPDTLASGNYLKSPASLLCPEDKTGNWGQLVQTGGLPLAPTPALNYSYLLEPLGWSDAEWKLLQKAGSNAGIAACQLHGLGTQAAPNVRNYSGLLLRAQIDGSVIRRQFFWSPALGLVDSGPGQASASALGFPGSADSPDPLQIFFDDPANWQGYQ